jgi:hypothetical protein
MPYTLSHQRNSYSVARGQPSTLPREHKEASHIAQFQFWLGNWCPLRILDSFVPQLSTNIPSENTRQHIPTAHKEKKNEKKRRANI